jgi:uncharacterized membrane protein HdeD (DUF308 family)
MSENTPPDLEALQQKMSDELAKHWKMFLFQGILMCLLGVVAVGTPQLATLAVGIFIGWLLVVGGIARIITLFRAPKLPGSFWSIITAILVIAVGLVLALEPLKGTLTLTMALIALFIFQGLASVIIAFQFRAHLKSWGWTLFSGIVDLVLAYMIWKGWPDSAAWAIGLLVGINLLFGGMTLIFTALAARPANPD